MRERIFGLLGRSLGHSYSVPIHRALGNEGYSLFEIEPERLGTFLERGDIGGLNVTIPYKRDAMAYCALLDDTAKRIGCVNTIVRLPDGRLKGYNTDASGLSFMADRAGISLSGRKVLIFGSGGASLTAQDVARTAGAREVAVVSRAGADNYENLNRHADAEVLINATPVGMAPHTGEWVADAARFPNCRGVLDLVYNPRRTALLFRAEELGIPNADGLPMLVAQAKAAEELFFDRKIDDGENERILLELRRTTQNIVLIGMPGSGKTTIGAALARHTGRTAIDLDEEIARAAGRSIPAIFSESGEAAFRALECDMARRWGRENGMILITGGGVVKDARNYAALKQNGRIYQIERDGSLLAREGRPLSIGMDLDAMLEERAPLYARFRDAAVVNDAAPEDAAKRIWEEFYVHVD